jgi:hypothetical protein
MKTSLSNATERALSFALAPFALAIGVIGIQRPMFIDEANSVIISSFNFGGILNHLRIDNNLPLYYLLLHEWTKWFGISEVAIRIPSIFFYFLGILTAHHLGKELSGNHRVGLYAAFFYAVSLQAVHLAQKVRMYSLLGLLAGLSTLFFFRYFWGNEGRRRDWVIYSLVNVLGLFTHVWFVFLIFAQLVCHLGLSRKFILRLMASLSFSGVLFCLLWGRSLLQQMRNGATSWMAHPTWGDLFGSVLEFYGGMKLGALFLMFCALLFLAKRGQPAAPPTEHDRRITAVLSLISVLGIGVPLFLSLFRPIYWPGRYTIIVLPCIAVLLGWLLTATVPRPILAGFAAVTLAGVVALQLASRHDMMENSEAILIYRDSDKCAAEVLLKMVRPGDRLIFTGLSRASIQYYFRLHHREQEVTMISFPVENAEHLGWDANQIDRISLQVEGEKLIEELSRPTMATAGQIWIVAGNSPVSNDILLDQMDKRFYPLRVLHQRGAFFTAVLLYGNSSNQTPTLK